MTQFGSTDTGDTFHMEMSLIGTVLSWLKIVNLDFRKEPYRTQDRAADVVGMGFHLFMIAINVLFIVYSGGIHYSENHDDSDDVQVNPVTDTETPHHHHKLHGLVQLCSNILVSVAVILLHLSVDDGKCNRTFMINVSRSAIILILQLPIQAVTLIANTPEQWLVWLLICQMGMEALVLYAYYPVWVKISNDSRDYVNIKKIFYLERNRELK